MTTEEAITQLKSLIADAEAWNRGEIDILLAHPASCAYGLNLQQGGHHVVWFGLTWSLELYQQANKRLHRQGQQYPVIIHRLSVVDGMDEEVSRALEGKQDTQQEGLRANEITYCVPAAHERRIHRHQRGGKNSGRTVRRFCGLLRGGSPSRDGRSVLIELIHKRLSERNLMDLFGKMGYETKRRGGEKV